MPIWPPTGLALAAILLRGLRVWPAIFAAAFAVGVPTDITDATASDSFVLSLAVAAGNTLAAVVGAYRLIVCSLGVESARPPSGVARIHIRGLVRAHLSDPR